MKDEKTLKQMVREYEQQMPPEIMNMITSFDWKRELREIVHQEALMLDVGTSLEESVYLLILGVVKVDDVYEDLIENHEVTEDKAQKVLYEIEQRIFQRLNAQLAKMDEDDERAQKRSEGSPATIGSKTSDVSRDDILAEIEKDDVPPPAMSNVVMPGTGTLAPASMEPATKPAAASRLGLSDPASDVSDSASKPVDRLGLRADTSASAPIIPAAPVSEEIVSQTISEPSAPQATTIPIAKPLISTDPIASGLSKPTATAAPVTSAPASAAPAAKSYSSDPYREPIE